MLKILEYVKKFLIFIILFCILAMIAIYTFLSSKQTYTANVVIEYTNTDAQRGYAPDGSKLDPTEIMSSKLIANVIENLNLSVSADYIRNRLTITEVIPENETEKKEAALKNGKEYEYFPTKYNISFTVNSKETKEFASDVLNNLLSEYYVYYGEHHINKEQLPANTESLLNDTYDYLETVEVMNNSVSDIISYLNIQSENYPDYRSAATGYSFKDLYNIYSNTSTDVIPSLFSYIFQNKITMDYDVLINKYNNRINDDELSEKTKDTQLEELKNLIDSYATKNKEQFLYNNKDNEDDLVIKNVENNTNAKKTTYDDLILQYVSTLEERRKLGIDIDYCQNVLNTFNKNTTTNQEIIKILQSNLKEENKNINDDYIILNNTVNELNEVLGAQNIAIRSNLIANDSVNMKLYLLLSFVAFIIIGICGSVVLGRLYDIIYYNLYYDKKTGLLNRTKCDQVIAEYAKKPVEETTYVILAKIDNLQEINDTFGRKYGDKILKEFGTIINNIFKSNAEAMYNGTNQFLIFAHETSKYMVNSQIEEIKHAITTRIDDIPVHIQAVLSSPIEDHTHKMRELVSKVYQKIARIGEKNEEKK